MKKLISVLLVGVMALSVFAIGAFAIDYSVSENASTMVGQFFVYENFEQDGGNLYMTGNDHSVFIICISEDTLVYFEDFTFVRDTLADEQTLADVLDGRMLELTIVFDSLAAPGSSPKVSPVSVRVLSEESADEFFNRFTTVTSTPVVDNALSEVFATLISSPVLVNGAEYEFEAYTIWGYNHFRLRDLAYVLNGTEAQFDITFDVATNTAYILRGQPYTPVGGEMTGRALANPHAPLRSETRFVIDGEAVDATAYNIEGNNFFRLRDVAAALDFFVDWDGRIIIDTSRGYVAN